MVGSIDGDIVGNLVGIFVVGRVVGIRRSEGDLVGNFDGDIVGKFVSGRIVGIRRSEGEIVGLKVDIGVEEEGWNVVGLIVKCFGVGIGDGLNDVGALDSLGVLDLRSFKDFDDFGFLTLNFILLDFEYK
mmetsp:Transcript_21662/g.30359  ORF Transcript_21662/g.30359 Transcript_21662/m.30359 type:complete len:130 (+) Transcript_21662:226-615(+)